MPSTSVHEKRQVKCFGYIDMGSGTTIIAILQQRLEYIQRIVLSYMIGEAV